MGFFFKVTPLKELRQTPNVKFHTLPEMKIHSVDRVAHGPNAFSPGSVAGVERPWYVHPDQEDNLLVFFGTRYVDLYSPKEKRVISFEVTPQKIVQDGKTVCETPALLSWGQGVFHRVRSGPQGSLSINFAVQAEGYDLDHNFDIYDLDVKSGQMKVIREGHLDQPKAK
ncbi:MAG: hypothetical protein HY917_05495 [Candidatus Diapherotrites archaeon]|nr:hypothetical protein [Candidatus Diapherotrites archaeon]